MRVFRRHIVRERYNATATGYDELYSEEQLEKYVAACEREGLKPEGLVLDDGCGTGLFIEYLLGRGMLEPVSYTICLDISEAMLGIARERFKRLRVDHLVDIVVADAENLPLRDSSVDYTYSFTVFTLLDSPQQGVKEALRVTRRLLIYTVLAKAIAFPGGRAPRFPGYRGRAGKDFLFVCSRNECNSLTQESS